jgi:hypothetical protein
MGNGGNLFVNTLVDDILNSIDATDEVGLGMVSTRVWNSVGKRRLLGWARQRDS